jgi:4-amino-4-deoxy-L-arabinose transferase-like glycosyltransferase
VEKQRLYRPAREWFLLLVICWLAFTVRMQRLDSQSLWVEEGIYLARVQQGLPAILSGEVAVDSGHLTGPGPPLYPLLLGAVRAMAGESLLTLRLTSVWLGVIGVASLWVLGRRLFGRAAGVAAALFGALSPYWVWYDQVAQSDSLLLTTSLLSILALHCLLVRPAQSSDGNGFWRGGLWFIATAAMLYSHRAGLAVFAFELLVLAIGIGRRRKGMPALFWMAAGLAVATPVISNVIGGPLPLDGYRAPWHEARRLIFAATRDQGAFGAGLRSLPTVILLLASIAWLASYPRRVRSLALALGYLLLPALIAVGMSSLWVGLGDPHYVVIGVPALYLVQGSGAAALWRHRRSLAVVAILAATGVMGFWLHFQATNPSFTKDDLKPAAAYVSQYATSDDVVILLDALIQPAWDYYYDGPAPVEVIPHLGGESHEEMLQRFLQAGSSHRRIWFLHRPEPPDCSYPGLLFQQAETRWVKLEEQTFSSPWLSVEVGQYTATPPVVDRLPVGATPAGICWPTGLCLQGWSADGLVAGSEAEVTLYWSQGNPTTEDYWVWLAVRDSQDEAWTEYRGPIFQFYPASRWPLGQLLQQTIRIPLSAAFPPTAFSLTAAVHWRASDQPLVSTAGKYHNPLGQVTVARPAEPPPASALSLQHKNDADFGAVVRLLGYNLPNDTPRPGHITFIDFYWQVLAQPAEDWQQRTRLIDKEGQLWVQETAPLGMSGFTVAQWQQDDLIWERVFLALPGQMPPGAYQLEVALLDADGAYVPAKEIWRVEESNSIVAGPAYLDSWPMVLEPPPMPNRPDAILGGAIRLWGYKIEPPGGKVRPGEELDVTLVWRDELPLEGDYRVFLHLMDGNESLLAQDDGVPADWTRPTTTWRPGEIIVDHYSLQVPADTAAGAAYLWAGMYDPGGSGRLPVLGARPGEPEDRILLDVVIIEP